MDHISMEVRAHINALFDKIDEHYLPLPYDITPDKHLGTIEVNWMLQDDLSGSRRVINAWPGEWVQARSSTAREPIFEFRGEALDINLWCHSDAVRMKIEVPS